MRKILLIAALILSACTNNSSSGDRWVKITVSKNTGTQIFGDTKSHSLKEASAWIKLDYSTNEKEYKNWKASYYFTKADCEKNRIKFLNIYHEKHNGEKIYQNKSEYIYPIPDTTQESAMNWLCGR